MLSFAVQTEVGSGTLRVFAAGVVETETHLDTWLSAQSFGAQGQLRGCDGGLCSGGVGLDGALGGVTKFLLPSVQVLHYPVTGSAETKMTATDGKHIFCNGWPEECDVQVNHMHKESTEAGTQVWVVCVGAA